MSKFVFHGVGLIHFFGRGGGGEELIMCMQYNTNNLYGLLTMFPGVYELRMYDLVLGKKEQWEHRIIQGLPDRCKLSEPVGVWFTEFGPQHRGTLTFQKHSSHKHNRTLNFIHEGWMLLNFLLSFFSLYVVVL